MPYRYLEEIAIADVAFEAWGATLEELFVAAADALVNVMIDDLAAVRREEELEVRLEENDLEFLLFTYLNVLVFFKDARRLLLRTGRLTITPLPSGYSLQAMLYGEQIDSDRHRTLVDVKAVTLHRFNVQQSADGWQATVILDI
jgi:SHS2 domain-containing protein